MIDRVVMSSMTDQLWKHCFVQRRSLNAAVAISIEDRLVWVFGRFFVKFSYELVHQLLGYIVELPTLKALAEEPVLNMTILALNLSNYVNGVAKRHAEATA